MSPEAGNRVFCGDRARDIFVVQRMALFAWVAPVRHPRIVATTAKAGVGFAFRLSVYRAARFRP
jgi:hypothetical protein